MEATLNLNTTEIANILKEVIKPLQYEIRDLKEQLKSMSSPLDKETLTIKEVAKILKVSEPTIYKFVKEKKLPKPVKFGRANVWYAKDVRKLIV